MKPSTHKEIMQHLVNGNIVQHEEESWMEISLGEDGMLEEVSVETLNAIFTDGTDGILLKNSTKTKVSQIILAIDNNDGIVTTDLIDDIEKIINS